MMGKKRRKGVAISQDDALMVYKLLLIGEIVEED